MEMWKKMLMFNNSTYFDVYILLLGRVRFLTPALCCIYDAVNVPGTATSLASGLPLTHVVNMELSK